MSVESSIVPLLESQFPGFYQEEGPQFIAFLKAYYEWMESENQALNMARKLGQIRDIDTTPEAFIEFFRKKYLYNVPLAGLNNKRAFFKHIKDFLSHKGTPNGIELFFRMFFDEEASVYYPSDDLLRPSDGQFFIPVYLELSVSSRTREFASRTITGVQSGATAVVEKIIRKGVQGKFFDVAYLSNLQGNFETGEFVVDDSGDIRNAPQVIGSLTAVDITLTGAGFEPGDTAEVISDITGKGGLVRIISVETATGRVTFTLVDGGWGFTSDAQVYVSERTLNDVNRTNANTEVVGLGTFWNLFETISQPKSTLTYINANGSPFALEGYVRGLDAGAGYAEVANGYILGHSNTGANGTLLITNSGGNWANATNLANTTANTAIVNSYVTSTSTGMLIGSNTTALGLVNVQGTFSSNNKNFLVGLSSNSYSNVSSINTGQGANFEIGAVGDTETVFVNTDFLAGNNAADAPYLSIILSGVGSNVGYVNAISVTANGSGYTNGQAVVFTGGTPTVAANAFITTNGSGNVVSATMRNVGYAYDSAPALSISGAGSGATLSANMVHGYGFPKFLGAHLNTVLNSALSSNTLTIGEISSLDNISPGANYNADPFVLVIEPVIAGFDRKDYILGLSGVSGSFAVGEQIIQNINQDTQTIQYANLATSIQSVTINNPGSGYALADTVGFSGGSGSGAAANPIRGWNLGVTGSSGLFVSGETVTQAVSGATGSHLFSNSSVVRLIPLSGSFNATDILTGGTSGASATATSNTANGIIGITMTNGGSGYLSVPTVSITTSTGSSFSGTAVRAGYQANEFVSQGGAEGTVQQVSITSAANGSIVVLVSNGSFQSNSTPVSSLANASFSVANNVVTSNNEAVFTTKGVIKSIPSPEMLAIERRSFSVAFGSGPIEGQTSGATATVDNIIVDDSVPPIGLNALITAEAGTVTGSIESFEVIDSGFAYEEAETVTLRKANSAFVATGIADLQKQGTGTGYFLSERGFLNNKRLHDNDYYQEFSYVVKTGVTLNRYSQILKDLLHVSGTKFFGELFKVVTANTAIKSSTTSIANNSGFILYETN